jgi:hypothetical protein
VLSRAARKVLDRLEVEHLNCGGKANGHLRVSYTQLAAAGVRPRSIPNALRELRALRLIKVTTSTAPMRAGQFGPANLYEITYLPVGAEPPTNDWREITTLMQAKKEKAAARRSRPRLRVVKQSA